MIEFVLIIIFAFLFLIFIFLSLTPDLEIVIPFLTIAMVSFFIYVLKKKSLRYAIVSTFIIVFITYFLFFMIPRLYFSYPYDGLEMAIFYLYIRLLLGLLSLTYVIILIPEIHQLLAKKISNQILAWSYSIIISLIILATILAITFALLQFMSFFTFI